MARIQAFFLAAAVVLGAAGLSSNAGAEPFSPSQKQQAEEIVRDFISKNPEFIIEALQQMQVRQQEEKKKLAEANLVKYRQALVADPTSPITGNPNGDVTVVEFFDYRCGFCKRALPTVREVLESDPNVRFVFKEFPILGPQSVFASRAAIAVHLTAPKKYLAFHNALMGSRGALTEDRVMSLAVKMGLDAKALRESMDDPRVEGVIQKNYELAQALDINGTPAFVVGGELVPGAIDATAMKEMISKARGS